jgi:hypothetical protein
MMEVNRYGEVTFSPTCENAIAFNMWLNAIEEKNDKKRTKSIKSSRYENKEKKLKGLK